MIYALLADPRLELAGPGEYNELLQAAQHSWALLGTSLQGGLQPPVIQEVSNLPIMQKAIAVIDQTPSG